jgi:hypothetical protein
MIFSGYISVCLSVCLDKIRLFLSYLISLTYLRDNLPPPPPPPPKVQSRFAHRAGFGPKRRVIDGMPRALPSSVGRRALPSSLSRGGTSIDDGLEQPATQSSVVPPRQHPSATDTGQPAVNIERAQATRAADAVDPAERERLVRVAAIHLHPDFAHSSGTGSASACVCAGEAEGAGKGAAAG